MFHNPLLDGREYQKEPLMETLVETIRITLVLTPKMRRMAQHGGLLNSEEDTMLKPLKYLIEKIVAQIDYQTSKSILEIARTT